MADSEQKLFNFTKKHCAGLLSYYNKGLSTFMLIFAVILLLFCLYLIFKSKPDVNNICFLILVLVGLNHFSRTYLNIVHEVKTDNSYLYIRKFAEFKKVSWDDIKCIKVTVYSTAGVSKLKIIKKKNSGKLPCRMFLIYGILSEIEITELRDRLFSEIEKKVKLIRSKWI